MALKDCKQRKHDCQMNKDGKCIALNNTEFQNKLCPFYKKIEKVIK